MGCGAAYVVLDMCAGEVRLGRWGWTLAGKVGLERYGWGGEAAEMRL